MRKNKTKKQTQNENAPLEQRRKETKYEKGSSKEDRRRKRRKKRSRRTESRGVEDMENEMEQDE